MQATRAHVAGEDRPQVGPGCENAREFDDVLARCLPAFHRRAYRQLGNAADAEDAVQNALLSAYKHLDQFKGGAQMSTWLTTIVINSARMQLRRRSRRIQVSLDEPLGEEQEYSLSERMADDKPSPEDMCRKSELHEHVRQLSTQLSPPLRRAFQLRHLDGLTIQEAALILGVPTGTVKAQVTRARTKLRQLLHRSLEAKCSSAPMRTSVAVVPTKTKRPRTPVTSTARLTVRRALPRRKVLRGQIPASLVAGWKVA
jgi:RNA polymerase sigma-70 factor (ECF subfamily)